MIYKYFRIAGFIVVRVVVATVFVIPALTQNIRIQLGKSSTDIPPPCESLTTTPIGKTLDVTALVREVNCKGAGDMMAEYTYEVKIATREKNRKGESKIQTTTYEVYIPTLKGGSVATGILLATSHNDVPVPEKDLEKQRMQAGQELEKEDKELSRQSAHKTTTRDYKNWFTSGR